MLSFENTTMKDKKIDGKRLREVAGAFPTGVSIITTEKEDGNIQGMTASSFLSVSLNPALVSFCIKEDSALYPLLKEGKRVGISILSAKQKAISNQFAGFNKEEIEVSLIKKMEGVSVIDKALAWYATEVYMIIPTGDHYSIFCKVLDLDRVSEGPPLVYWSGYRTTGDNI